MQKTTLFCGKLNELSENASFDSEFAVALTFKVATFIVFLMPIFQSIPGLNGLNTENLTNLMKENSCFKGASLCIDLILTNSKNSFQYSSSIENGLSDHHHLIFSMMKTKLVLVQPKGLVYRNFKSFNNNYFEEELSSNLDLTTRTTRFLRITLLMFLINMLLKRQK